MTEEKGLIQETPQQPSPDETPLPPVAEMDALRAFWNKHGTSILVGLTAFVVVLLGQAVYQRYTVARQTQAEQALFAAHTPEALQKVMNDYARTPVGPMAMVLMGSMAYDRQDFNAAQAAYEELLKRHARHPLAPVAELGLAQCAEASGDLDAARTAFQKFITQRKDHYMLPVAVLGASRCLQQQNHFDEARAVLEDFMVAHPDNAWMPQMETARMYLNKDQRAAAQQPPTTTPTPTAAATPSPATPAAPVIKVPTTSAE